MMKIKIDDLLLFIFLFYVLPYDIATFAAILCQSPVVTYLFMHVRQTEV